MTDLELVLSGVGIGAVLGALLVLGTMMVLAGRDKTGERIDAAVELMEAWHKCDDDV